MGQSRNPKIRRDGWTADRQLRFLDALAQTGSVGKAARAAGMSREGAYRHRSREEGLFALLWDRVLQPAASNFEGHIESLSGGRLMRLMGNHFRRERGDFRNIRSARAKARAG